MIKQTPTENLHTALHKVRGWFEQQPPEYQDEVLAVVREFCETHYRFCGGDVLAWARTVKGLSAPPDRRSWRNVWSAVLSEARTRGWVRPIGRGVPGSVQSHTASLTLWQSLLCGPQTEDDHEPPMRAQLGVLRSAFRKRELDLTGLVNAVAAYSYECGVEDARRRAEK